MLLRRAFSIHDVRPDHGGTVEFVFAVVGPGTRWLAERRTRDVLDVAGPLGRPFPGSPRPGELPAGRRRVRQRAAVPAGRPAARAGAARLTSCSAPPAATGCSARSPPAATGRTATITTEDGSLGVRGMVTDVLGQVIHEAQDRCDLRLRPDGDAPPGDGAGAAATTSRRRSLVEESMACGIGVCMTCVLPVVGEDGMTRMVRSCVDGPVFRGDLVRWDDVGTDPVRRARRAGLEAARPRRSRAAGAGPRRRPARAGQRGTGQPGPAAGGPLRREAGPWRLTCGPGWGTSSCPTPS